MHYNEVVSATFLERPNRFIAHCLVDGVQVVAHVKNTGRCRELLIPGVTVYLEHAPSPSRKTDYSLIAVQKGGLLINIDSQIPNGAAYEAILAGKLGLGEISFSKREYKYGNSRIDIFLETVSGRKILVEVKGVTLERDGVAMFPDAPTARGTKHVYELANAIDEGYECIIFFVIQFSPVNYFEPNRLMDPKLADALRHSSGKGVRVLAYDCQVSPNQMEVRNKVEVIL
ncbi:MAG: DNA/RNA nuclease SfsA [Turicibacter sp.]|nr:DNA/RNA nuclease SfsA [Turicibacter sp.]